MIKWNTPDLDIVVLNHLYAGKGGKMNENETAIKELNSFYKGEHMAIHAYDRYIEEIQDEAVKNTLRQFQNDHKRHADEISKRIEALGGKPDESTGMAGIYANAKEAVENLIKHDTADTLKRAFDGEDKGVAMAEELIKGDLDTSSRQIVDQILNEDHGHLNTMTQMISGMENQQNQQKQSDQSTC